MEQASNVLPFVAAGDGAGSAHRSQTVAEAGSAGGGDAASDYASEEWIYDFTTPGEPTRTHASPSPPERAAGDDVEKEEDAPPSSLREPETVSFDDDLPTPW